MTSVCKSTAISSEATWNNLISDWSLLGSPLRPAPEDTTAMECMVRDWHRCSPSISPRAGILGVTPEIVGMRWPEQTRITAFDKEPAMIAAFWPKEGIPHATAICCNWLSFPLEDTSLEVIAGDGSLTLLSFPDQYTEIARELSRVVVPGGIIVLRLFVPPLERESVDYLFDELWKGSINNFNAFRWRLVMALQENPENGVCMGDAWEVWHSKIPEPESLAKTLGWPIETVRMIDRYRSLPVICSFPTLVSLCSIMEPNFTLTERFVPSYQDGERYPTVCFQRR